MRAQGRCAAVTRPHRRCTPWQLSLAAIARAGTNFDVLPELHWEWGYGWFYIVCVISTVIMCGFMYRLGLIGGR